jgi:DNA-binding NtrC family response regulator
LQWVFPNPSAPAVDLPGAASAGHVLGREAGCAIPLTGADVSRRHAALRWAGAVEGSGVEIVDLGSRNGVSVNGDRVVSACLAAGDVVRVGTWLGVVTESPGPCAEIAPGLLGGGTLRAALQALQAAARSDLPIILEGETGTGKELVARAVHAWSGRSGPWLAVNCAALPETLAEGELFGYRRGAFSGAERAAPGFFRSAEGGTLLLDEIADLPVGLQAKLLRVLEAREVQPLGEVRPVAVDVRVVVAAQGSLLAAVQQGRFRADLLGRLDGLTVKLPPLRHRREDVPHLFFQFLKGGGEGEIPAVEGDVLERLCLHDWPFNVRELHLLARRLRVLHPQTSTFEAAHLPERIGRACDPGAVAGAAGAGAGAGAGKGEGGAAAMPPGPALLGVSALLVALRASGGNVARAAAMLGITRQRAYRLMEGEGVDLEALRSPAAEDPS